MWYQPRRPAAAGPFSQPEPQHLPQAPPPPASDGHPADAPPAGHSVRWLAAAGFAFLIFNSGMAVHRSRGDLGAIAFVAFSHLDLLALFLCLRRYEGARPGSPLRDQLRMAIWLLTSALTLMFSSKVAAVVPGAVAAVVWLVAFGTVAGGFYALFFCGNEDKQSNVFDTIIN
ncbi:hypothetical protein SETIT_1G035400v2 [Setaria italica]|uniref:Uncharacterized protein n=1 Tax=Setaria italica TaxID=4555 RepID=K3YW53_SETIT|nr:uncharacterized protein LOC101770571 [Setaria italica]RCV04864.1 hypothetical protein SETIT_1G035400v2 [Setaria italica]